MLVVHEILGSIREERFAGRRIERLMLDSIQAQRRRQLASTDQGTEIALDLERGAYLADGAVVLDDGERIIVVERAPEPALVVRLASHLTLQETVAQAVRLGHAFGNQHVPLEVEDGEVRIPITTSTEVALESAAALGLVDAEIIVSELPLGRDQPLSRGHSHDHLSVD